jgi:hypothetical protein
MNDDDDTRRSIEELLTGDPWQDDHTQAITEARYDLWAYLEAAEHAHQGIARTVRELREMFDAEVAEGNTAAADTAVTALTVSLAALRDLWQATR